MKVKDLILLLEKEDGEKRIVLNGYEGGFDELKELKRVCISPNPDKLKDPSKLWWLGDFEECIYADGEEIAILLPRTS
jgi:calcineurin-like phosphoesterase family protein